MSAPVSETLSPAGQSSAALPPEASNVGAAEQASGRARLVAGEKQKGEAKTARIPIKVVAAEPLRKPSWIRVKVGGSDAGRFAEIKRLLREQHLHTVCEEASCPNIGECFGRGTATFMILGDLCTRRCPFCDVGHGKPLPPDPAEPAKIAASVAALKLRYVVITSVDRDDLRDGGAAHFVAVIRAIRAASPATVIETLVPDFRGRMDVALDVLCADPPDVLNHNLETVPRLYKQARPGADYAHSLLLLKAFKARCPTVATKSGLMVGLGETDEEILEVLADLRRHDTEMLTIGQYLAPSAHHLPVTRYVHPDVFVDYQRAALKLGFTAAACGPLIRSSYWADKQADAAGVVL
ncbi:lipoyl synthase [Rhodocyclus tenuis]|uniref:lipoyl synthase n=1 Tax=Rhodocyclus tenuis TaxID=1066 RepID=UPI0019076541|nr:lipoyl synthase [Rhodocyclus tenuis]MBK1681465.1 lipoyl synthase [Rhodocyclus tenuis]